MNLRIAAFDRTSVQGVAGERRFREPADHAYAAKAVKQTPSGVVLAGTHPWGDCPLDRASPRPLVPVANKPLVLYGLEWLRSGGVESASVCGNSHTDVIRRALGACRLPWSDVGFLADAMPRGPAGCVRDAAMMQDADLIIVVDGTMIPQVDAAGLLAAHQASGNLMTIVVHGAGPEDVRAKHELTPTGVYVFSKEVLSFVPEKGYQDIKETLIPLLHAKGRAVGTYQAKEVCPRVTGADTYLMVNEWMVERCCAKNRSSRQADGDLSLNQARIDAAACVHPTARLIGPVLIGPDVTIGRDAVIVGPTSIGKNSSIGDMSVISRSAIWNGCVIGLGSVVDKSVLPHGAKVREGSTVRRTVWTPRHEGSSVFGRLIRRRQPVDSWKRSV